MAEAILPRLNRAGRFILYSGSAIICGTDALKDRLNALAEKHHCTLRYRELDPDVFGEELTDLNYAEVDRIAFIPANFDHIGSASRRARMGQNVSVSGVAGVSQK